MPERSAAPPRCYVASPLGFTEAGRTYYAETFLPALGRVVTCVDPWSSVTAAEIEAAAASGRLRDLWLQVGRLNRAAIETSTVLVGYLDGQELDAGTASEIGYAAAKGVRCFGLRTDLRQSGEQAVNVNLQVESFIVESGGTIAGSLAELLRALALLAEPTDASTVGR